MESKKMIPIGIIGLMLGIAWIKPHRQKEIESAMNRYNRSILFMNTDSIANNFAVDGDLGSIAHGRDSITRFLLRFKEFKVLSQTSATKRIKISADSAFQTGMYWQTTIVPPHDMVHVKGNFSVHWIWSDHDGWKIKRMDTQPLK